MSALYFTGSRVEKVAPSNKKEFTLKELQGYVEGYIEIIPIPMLKAYLVVDEEGKLKEKDINSEATMLLNMCGYKGDYIVGKALLCPENELK